MEVEPLCKLDRLDFSETSRTTVFMVPSNERTFIINKTGRLHGELLPVRCIPASIVAAKAAPTEEPLLRRWSAHQNTGVRPCLIKAGSRTH